MEDNRIHLLLYFFDGHHTKPGDLTMIKKLQKYVNIIPIIAKADSFKRNELIRIKSEIVTRAKERKIEFFDCYKALSTVTDD